MGPPRDGGEWESDGRRLSVGRARGRQGEREREAPPPLFSGNAGERPRNGRKHASVNRLWDQRGAAAAAATAAAAAAAAAAPSCVKLLFGLLLLLYRISRKYFINGEKKKSVLKKKQNILFHTENNRFIHSSALIYHYDSNDAP